jgi:hypothetical protein
MIISIFSGRKSIPAIDNFALDLGHQLSDLGHTLHIGSSAFGVPEAIRLGAEQASRRAVHSYYVRLYNPKIAENRDPKNGFFFKPQESVLDRFSLVNLASAILILSVDRSNVGVALNCLYEQRESTRKAIDSQILDRLILFYEPGLCLPNPLSGKCVDDLPYLQEIFGKTFDEEDFPNFQTVNSVDRTIGSITEWQTTLTNIWA